MVHVSSFKFPGRLSRFVALSKCHKQNKLNVLLCFLCRQCSIGMTCLWLRGTYNVHTEQFHFTGFSVVFLGLLLREGFAPCVNIFSPLLSMWWIDTVVPLPGGLFLRSISVWTNLPRLRDSWGLEVEGEKTVSFPFPFLDGWALPVVNTDPEGCGTSHLALVSHPSSEEEKISMISSSTGADDQAAFGLLSILLVDDSDLNSSRNNSQSFVQSFWRSPLEWSASWRACRRSASVSAMISTSSSESVALASPSTAIVQGETDKQEQAINSPCDLPSITNSLRSAATALSSRARLLKRIHSSTENSSWK